MMKVNISQAQTMLRQGAIIAYPTEAVFGLGCDPFNKTAVMRLLSLKARAAEKGLIVLISQYAQLWPLITPLAEEEKQRFANYWPGPTTLLLPKSEAVPSWVSGESSRVACRMSAHPIASKLSESQPIVSTSANLSGQPAITCLNELIKQFTGKIDGYVEGELGGEHKPSRIIDFITEQQYR